MSLLELREIAKEKDLKNVSKMKKQELAEMLESLENQEKPTNEQSIKNNSSRENDGTYKPNNENDEIAEGILEVEKYSDGSLGSIWWRKYKGFRRASSCKNR